MTNPSAGGSYVRQPDGTLKLVEETAQLGSAKHEDNVAADVQPEPAAETTKPRAARQKE